MFIHLSPLPCLGFNQMEADDPSTSGLPGDSNIAETPSGNVGVSLALEVRETAETMPRLSEAERNNAIGRVDAGQSFSAVSRVFNVSLSTISRLRNRYQQQGTSRDRPRSGRPRVTTRGQYRYIRLRHLRDRTTTASFTASNIPGLRRISAQTVRNRLREAGLRSRRPVHSVILTAQHRLRRRQWCQQQDCYRSKG